MSDEPHDDDSTTRQQRLDALRELMGSTSVTDETRALGRTPAPQSAQPQPAMEALIGGEAPRPAAGARRWRVVALTSVAALIIVATVAVAILRNGAATAPGSKPAPALTVKAFSLTAEGAIYCTSEPAWSPNGKSIAVFGQTNTPTNDCLPYNYQTALISPGVSNLESTNRADAYAIVIFDSATGHVMQRIALPMLSQSALSQGALCQGATPCGIQNIDVQSLAWSPDGRSVGVFFTYEQMTGPAGSSSPQAILPCGGLALAQTGSSATPRLLLAAGLPLAQNATSLPGSPRFTWNLATGAATSTAIPNALTGSAPPFTPSYQWAPTGQFVQTTGDTTPFAQTYQWTADGQLSAATSQASQPPQASNAISAWRGGVVGQRRNAGDPALYRTSQWAWSPDGRYVTPNLGTSAYINLPGSQQPGASGSYTPPLVNPPYTAMSAAIAASLSSPPGVALAQSPSGALLAAYACTPDGLGQMTIRPTKSATESAQATYTYPSTLYSLACLGDISDLFWSPDGSRIALTDTQTSEIIVWQVNIRA